MKVLTSRLGVPYLVMDEEVIPLSHANVDDLIAVELMEPGTLDQAMGVLRQSVEDLTGIDAGMGDIEWWTTFNGLLAINEFTTPLHALGEARHRAEQIQREAL